MNTKTGEPVNILELVHFVELSNEVILIFSIRFPSIPDYPRQLKAFDRANL